MAGGRRPARKAAVAAASADEPSIQTSQQSSEAPAASKPTRNTRTRKAAEPVATAEPSPTIIPESEMAPPKATRTTRGKKAQKTEEEEPAPEVEPEQPKKAAQKKTNLKTKSNPPVDDAVEEVQVATAKPTRSTRGAAKAPEPVAELPAEETAPALTRGRRRKASDAPAPAPVEDTTTQAPPAKSRRGKKNEAIEPVTDKVTEVDPADVAPVAVEQPKATRSKRGKAAPVEPIIPEPEAAELPIKQTRGKRGKAAIPVDTPIEEKPSVEEEIPEEAPEQPTKAIDGRRRGGKRAPSPKTRNTRTGNKEVNESRDEEASIPEKEPVEAAREPSPVAARRGRVRKQEPSLISAVEEQPAPVPEVEEVKPRKRNTRRARANSKTETLKSVDDIATIEEPAERIILTPKRPSRGRRGAPKSDEIIEQTAKVEEQAPKSRGKGVSKPATKNSSRATRTSKRRIEDISDAEDAAEPTKPRLEETEVMAAPPTPLIQNAKAEIKQIEEASEPMQMSMEDAPAQKEQSDISDKIEQKDDEVIADPEILTNANIIEFAAAISQSPAIETEQHTDDAMDTVSDVAQVSLAAEVEENLETKLSPQEMSPQKVLEDSREDNAESLITEVVSDMIDEERDEELVVEQAQTSSFSSPIKAANMLQTPEPEQTEEATRTVQETSTDQPATVATENDSESIVPAEATETTSQDATLFPPAVKQSAPATPRKDFDVSSIAENKISATPIGLHAMGVSTPEPTYPVSNIDDFANPIFNEVGDLDAKVGGEVVSEHAMPSTPTIGVSTIPIPHELSMMASPFTLEEVLAHENSDEDAPYDENEDFSAIDPALAPIQETQLNTGPQMAPTTPSKAMVPPVIPQTTAMTPFRKESYMERFRPKTSSPLSRKPWNANSPEAITPPRKLRFISENGIPSQIGDPSPLRAEELGTDFTPTATPKPTSTRKGVTPNSGMRRSRRGSSVRRESSPLKNAVEFPNNSEDDESPETPTQSTGPRLSYYDPDQDISELRMEEIPFTPEVNGLTVNILENLNGSPNPAMQHVDSLDGRPSLTLSEAMTISTLNDDKLIALDMPRFLEEMGEDGEPLVLEPMSPSLLARAKPIPTGMGIVNDVPRDDASNQTSQSEPEDISMMDASAIEEEIVQEENEETGGNIFKITPATPTKVEDYELIPTSSPMPTPLPTRMQTTVKRTGHDEDVEASSNIEGNNQTSEEVEDVHTPIKVKRSPRKAGTPHPVRQRKDFESKKGRIGARHSIGTLQNEKSASQRNRRHTVGEIKNSVTETIENGAPASNTTDAVDLDYVVEVAIHREYDLPDDIEELLEIICSPTAPSESSLDSLENYLDRERIIQRPMAQTLAQARKHKAQGLALMEDNAARSEAERKLAQRIKADDKYSGLSANDLIERYSKRVKVMFANQKLHDTMGSNGFVEASLLPNDGAQNSPAPSALEVQEAKEVEVYQEKSSSPLSTPMSNPSLDLDVAPVSPSPVALDDEKKNELSSSPSIPESSEIVNQLSTSSPSAQSPSRGIKRRLETEEDTEQKIVKKSRIPTLASKMASSKSLTERELSKLTARNTTRNSVFKNSNFERQVIRMPGRRPPSPSRESQALQAEAAREARLRIFEETGVMLGPGDELSFQPPPIESDGPRRVRFVSGVEHELTSPERRKFKTDNGILTAPRRRHHRESGNIHSIKIKRFLYDGEIDPYAEDEE